MDERRPDMRISDRDRAAAAERLRLALGEGRLDLLEYDDRLARAFAAVTYADLAPLFADLPETGEMTLPTVPPLPVSVSPARPAPSIARLPAALKVLWTIWLAAVSINLTVWVLVSVGNGDPGYFWPMWLAVPGAALFGISAATLGLRGPEPPALPPAPPSPARPDGDA